MQTVMVLEDHPETRDWLCRIINQAFTQANISQASSQAQARQLLATKKFDLALIDLNLPDGNGVDIIREISRQSPATYCVVASSAGKR